MPGGGTVDVRKFYLDLALDDPLAIRAGDVIAGPRKRWIVTEAYPTDSKVWGNRWTLRLRDDDTIQVPSRHGRRVISSAPYRRGEGPHDHF